MPIVCQHNCEHLPMTPDAHGLWVGFSASLGASNQGSILYIPHYTNSSSIASPTHGSCPSRLLSYDIGVWCDFPLKTPPFEGCVCQPPRFYATFNFPIPLCIFERTHWYSLPLPHPPPPTPYITSSLAELCWGLSAELLSWPKDSGARKPKWFY